MVCKGECEIRGMKAPKPRGKGRYASGQKRCQTCSIFIQTIAIWCPCCGTRLRGNPRNIKYKAQLREEKRKETICL